jgi:hypothetical protein
MAKRFTDTAIWQDDWFMNLPPDYKLAFMFIKDNCDQAGVWKPNKRLAETMLGVKIEWDDFLISCDGRVKLIQGEYWWITRFVEFQYGTLSENCKPHIPVINLLRKYQLFERVSKGYPKGIETLEEKEQEKEKEKEKEKEEAEIVEIFYPFNSPNFLNAWNTWMDYRKEIKKPYKSKKSEQAALKQLSEFDEPFSIQLIERSIAGGYQGLVFDNTKAEYLKNGKQTTKTGKPNSDKLDQVIDAMFGAKQ